MLPTGKISVVAIAFWLMDYRALIAGLVVSSVVGLLLSYAIKPYRPRLTFVKAREYFAFSAWVQMANVISFMNQNAKNFVVGSLHGVAELGLLNIASNIATLTGGTIQGPINQASYPAFAKKAHDLIALRDQYASVLAYVTLLALPTSVGIALITPHAIPLFLGSKWVGAIVLVQILAFAGVAQSLTAASNPVFMALNKPNLVFVFAASRLCILVPTMIVGAKLYGVVGVAAAVALVSAVLMPLRQFATRAALRCAHMDLVKPLVRPVLATAVMAATFLAADRVIDLGQGVPGQIAEMLILVSLGAATFTMTISIHWRLIGQPDGPERDLLHTIKRYFNIKAAHS